MDKKNLHTTMRIYHRYLGFFLAGIMAMYAISGVLLIFRETNFLKIEKQNQKILPADIKPDAIGKELKIRNFAIEKEDNGIIYFKEGTFDTRTHIANFTTKELPFILQKMTRLHKATHKDPLYFLNIFFGISLFFFVLSSFWMFLPKTTIFKKGLYFTIAGIALTLILIFL